MLGLCVAHPAIPSFAVVEGASKVIGLIERKRPYFQFSQPLWFDVHNRRPIAPLLTREALIADRFPQAISSGFAIVERGSYLGMAP